MLENLVVAEAASGTFPGSMIFIFVSMLVLMFLLKKYAWGPVTKMMDERAEKIADDIDTAEKARVEANRLATQRQEELKNSKAEAVAIVTAAKENGNKQGKVILDKTHDEVKQMQANAQRDIEQAKEDALKDVKKDVAALSIDIASQLIQKELKSDEQQNVLIDSYIEGLGNANETR